MKDLILRGKAFSFFAVIIGLLAGARMGFAQGTPVPTNPPPIVMISNPTNGSTFLAPATIQLIALAGDTNGFVASVEFFANDRSLGIVTNFVIVDPIPGGSKDYHYAAFLNWSNVPAGSYSLTAVVADDAGTSATSAPVNISVVGSTPPPPAELTITTPPNGSTFFAGTNIQICATGSNGYPAFVQFFANNTSLGIVSNNPPTGGVPTLLSLCLTWTNAPAGIFSLRAVGSVVTSAGAGGSVTITSPPVEITVVTNVPPPPVVVIESPANGAKFLAGANVQICASGRDPDGRFVSTEFFANGLSLGSVSNYTVVPIEAASDIHYSAACLIWSNVPTGAFALTAVGTDNNSLLVTSAPVNIFVLTNVPPPPPTNLPAVVSIYAPDPVAVEGTNFVCLTPGNVFSNYYGGTNTATFLVRRAGDTNADLTVFYGIGGTASNGLDYAMIPNHVTIPAGQRYALITIVPLIDIDPVFRLYDTVVLDLQPSPVASPVASYIIGSPAVAGAIILEDNVLPVATTTATNFNDCIFHVCMPGTNGANFCLQVSTNLVDWLPICTNTVVKGAIEFVDPEACGFFKRFYRAVQVADPAQY